jgi:hypothetical protein
MKTKILNTITTTGFVTIRCPFCQENRKHEINFKCYGFDSQVHEQNVTFYKTCTACDFVKSQITVMLKSDYEQLKMVKQ